MSIRFTRDKKYKEDKRITQQAQVLISKPETHSNLQPVVFDPRVAAEYKKYFVEKGILFTDDPHPCPVPPAPQPTMIEIPHVNKHIDFITHIAPTERVSISKIFEYASAKILDYLVEEYSENYHQYVLACQASIFSQFLLEGQPIDVVFTDDQNDQQVFFNGIFNLYNFSINLQFENGSLKWQNYGLDVRGVRINEYPHELNREIELKDFNEKAETELVQWALQIDITVIPRYYHYVP